MNEACLAFYDYPHRSQKIQLVQFWYSKGWVPAKSINWWHRNSKAVKDGDNKREWLKHKKGEWLEDGKIKSGREPYAEVHDFVHELCCGRTIGEKEVGQMLETVHSKRNREECVFHI